MPGMNPRDMQKAMKKMGIKQEEIDAVAVVIRAKNKDIIIRNPSVQIIDMMGQKSYQISGEEEIREIEEEIEIGEEDIKTNRQIGQAGKELIKDGSTILTHCNAGALATAGYGTALGVIRAAFESGRSIDVLACETRPFLQGARLTAWELKKSGIPVTVITDSMAGYAMQKKKISVVITGADCICLNGDVANKIGTYSLAVLAKEHGIPFYVAAPLSSINLSLKDGKTVVIEERDGKEVTHIGGKRMVPEGVKVWNPAFDITPSKYIGAIITEKEIVKRPYGRNLKNLL